MISWRDPLSLVALALGPALALFFAWTAQRRRAALAAFVAVNLWPAVAPDLDPRRRTLRAALLLTAVLLLAAALGGPLWGFRWEEVKREGIDLVIALDTSRSMLATDVKPSRLARAKLAVRDLIGRLHGDRVALVAFAGTAFVQCPLTLDYGAFAESLDATDVGIIPKGGTALAAAIDTSLAALEGREGKHQAVILITDGEDHEGKVKEATEHASARGVKVFTVGLGTTEGELIPGETGSYVKDRKGQVVKSRLDEATLQQIGVDTGGTYLHATGASFGLTELYRDAIGTMEKRELASTLERRFEERFQIPLAFALFLLLAEPLVGERGTAARPRMAAATGAADRRPRRTARAVLAVVLALASLGWLDRHATTREANRLFAKGEYDSAAAKYNQALLDQPDSPLLHFNLGDADYQQKKYDDALAAYEKAAAPEDEPRRTAALAYNVGNTRYRQGEAAENSDPTSALEHYAQALASYRRALGAAPDDPDVKFNYEFVLKKMDELKKKLEEQQRKQEQQRQNQPKEDKEQEDAQQQPQGDQPQESPQQQAHPEQQKQPGEGEQQARPGQEKPPEDQAAGGDQKEPPTRVPEHQPDGDQQQATGEAGESEAHPADAGEMSRREAAALLDSQRGEEVRPDEMIRKLQGGAVAAPAQDW